MISLVGIEKLKVALGGYQIAYHNHMQELFAKKLEW
jgi:hypothetical protein